MNYLAHLLLSDDDPACRLGNLLGDHAAGRLESLDYPPDVLRGIRMHRAIDAFTDAHPINRESAELLKTGVGRYAPILVDMFHDYFLARHFQSFYDQTLQDYAAFIYDELAPPLVPVPDSLASFINAMRSHDILSSYQHRYGIEEALLRIGRRTRHNCDLVTPGMVSLTEHHAHLESAFLDFYPEVQAHVASF